METKLSSKFGSLSAMMYEIDDWCGTGYPGKFPPKKNGLRDLLISVAIHNLANQISDVKARKGIQSIATELYVAGGQKMDSSPDPIPAKRKGGRL